MDKKKQVFEYGFFGSHPVVYARGGTAFALALIAVLTMLVWLLNRLGDGALVAISFPLVLGLALGVVTAWAVFKGDDLPAWPLALGLCCLATSLAMGLGIMKPQVLSAIMPLITCYFVYYCSRRSRAVWIFLTAFIGLWFFADGLDVEILEFLLILIPFTVVPLSYAMAVTRKSRAVDTFFSFVLVATAVLALLPAPAGLEDLNDTRPLVPALLFVAVLGCLMKRWKLAFFVSGLVTAAYYLVTLFALSSYNSAIDAVIYMTLGASYVALAGDVPVEG